MKMPAPLNNQNRTRTHEHGKQSLMTLGTPPRPMAFAVEGARAVMAEIRRAIVELRESTSVFDEALILQLGEHEVTRRLAWRIWRTEKGLSVEQLIALRHAADRASEGRTRVLKALRLNEPKDDAWQWAIPEPLPNEPQAPPACEPAPPCDDRTEPRPDGGSDQ